MGIRGLSSYIQQRSEKYLKTHHLHDCRVVIDGSNLLHFLYLSCPKQNASFGGDYNTFADHLREVLRLFKQCKVTPIIIFDGSLDIGDRKQKTRLLRAKQKLIASIKVKPTNQHRMSVLPLLLKSVFLSVLKEFKIEVIQCQYEADGDIAALSRGLKCPVVSNDSDFYVMDVLVVPLSLMELNSPVKCSEGPSKFAIQCKLFQMEDFLKAIGHKDASIFPLMGTLLGNDYADKRLFENVFSQIRLPKNKSANEQHRRLRGLLDWLKGQTVEEAIDRILQSIKKVHHTEVEVAIRTSLNAYADENDGSLDSVSALVEKIVAGLGENGLPEWFGRLYAGADVPQWSVEIAVSHRMPYQSQVESVRLSNSFSCCSNLLKAVALVCWDDQADNKLTTIWRKNSELVFKRLTVTRMDFETPIPSLSTAGSMTQLEKQAVLFHLLLDGSPGRLLTELPPQWQLAFASMVHWVRHSHCHVKTYHLDGLVAGLIHLSMVEPKIGRIRSLKRLENLASGKEKGDPLLEYIRAGKNTFKFQQADERMLSHDINYDRETVHVLAEFQATFYMAQSLSQVLDTGLSSASPSSFFNGTFIYQAASHFKGYDRLVLAEKLYGAGSELFRTFQHYTELVCELAPPSLTDWTARGPNKPRKKRNKKPKEEEAAVSSSSSSNSEDETVIDADLLDNRFNLLAVA